MSKSGQPAARLGDLIGHVPTDFKILLAAAPAALAAGAAAGAAAAAMPGTKFSPGIPPKVPSGAIVKGSLNVFINKRPAGHKTGAIAPCVVEFGMPIPVKKGARTVKINKRDAARIGDPMMCKAKIVSGSSNVIIGDSPPRGQRAAFVKRLPRKARKVPPKKAFYHAKDLSPRHFDAETGDQLWPKNDGFVEGDRKTDTLEAGTIVDRYAAADDPLNDGGYYLSPAGTSWEARALPYNPDTQNYHRFKVVKDFSTEEGGISPAFDQAGNGTQFMTDKQVMVLVEEGYIEPLDETGPYGELFGTEPYEVECFDTLGYAQQAAMIPSDPHEGPELSDKERKKIDGMDPAERAAYDRVEAEKAARREANHAAALQRAEERESKKKDETVWVDPVEEARMEAEYLRQLQGQEAGLRNMSAADFLRRVALFEEGGREGVSDGTAQEEAIEVEKSKLNEEIRTRLDDENRLLPPSERRDDDELEVQARLEADNVMATLAALHDPDMSVGGEDIVKGFGDRGVNSSIGAQWKQGKYRDHRYYEDKKAGLNEKKRHKGRIAQMIKYAEAVVAQNPDNPDAPMDVRLVSCGEAVKRPNPKKDRTKLDRDRLGRDTRHTDKYKGTT